MRLCGEQLESRLCCCAEGEPCPNPLPPDVNYDGVVDKFDLALLNRMIEQQAYNVRQDVNCDATIDGNDMALVNAAMGQGERVAPLEQVRCDDPRYFAADITYDGSVDDADVMALDEILTAMALSPGKTGLYDQRLYDIRKDINCDGSIDLGDFGLLNVQFGASDDRGVAESLRLFDSPSLGDAGR